MSFKTLVKLAALIAGTMFLALAAAAQDKAPLRVGWAEFPPYGSRSSDGTPTGFSVEVARAIAERAGLEIELIEYPDPGAWVRAQAEGETDFMIPRPSAIRNQISIGPENFSQVYLFLPIEGAGDIDVGDVSGLRIGVGRVTSSAAITSLLERNTRVTVQDGISGIVMLLSGKIDALVGGQSVTRALRDAKLDHRIVAIPPPLFGAGFVLNPARADLEDVMREAVDSLVADGTIDQIKARWADGVILAEQVPHLLKVGIFDLPPYQSMTDGGEPVGFAVDILRDLARQAGFELDFVPITAEQFADGPSWGTYDILPQAGVSEPRSDRFDFSLPIETDSLSFFVLPPLRDRVSGFADLAGRSLGVVTDSVADHHVEAMTDLDLRRFATLGDLVAGLLAGKVDVALSLETAFLSELKARKRLDDVVTTGASVASLDRAIAIRRGLPTVRARFDQILPGYIVSARYSDLRLSHFGQPPYWTAEKLIWLGAGVAGVIIGALAISLNLMRRRSSNYLQAAHAGDRLKAVFSAVSGGIVGLDADRNVITLNPPARHMLGGIVKEPPFPWPDKIEFLRVEDLTPLDSSSDPINRALAGKELKGETHLMTRAQKDRDNRYVRISSATVSQNETGLKTVVVLDDVSEQEKNRQQIERRSRLDALGQLTGGIAHDFNNLLATISYAIDLSLKQNVPERAEGLLRTALLSVDRGRSLTQRLLAFARRQPGLASSRSVGAVLDDFESLVRPTIEEHIQLTFEAKEPQMSVFCDQPQLENALLNIVLNSRDAILRSGKGSNIKVSARAIAGVGKDLDDKQRGAGELGESDLHYRYVEFTVTDDGPGMPPEVARRAADPFFTTKDTNSGTGLGLSIVYGFVQQSNGDLRIYSEEGHGTTISLTLPRGAPEGRERPIAGEPLERGHGETILVVEDEAMLLMMLEEVLEELGYKVVSAESGKSAVELIEDGIHFDLLLTDVVMPGGISGFVLAERVRAMNTAKPIIYMSGYTGYSKEEMGSVPAALLQKPCPPNELAEAIKAALSKSKAS